MSHTVPTAHVPTSSRMVFAHRGLNHQAPENTMPAFEAAAGAGVQWIETDVDIIADGTPILIHDSTLERTTNRTGGFYGLTRADLSQIDAGAWFGRDFRGTRIPLLSDLVTFMNEAGVNANIELKAHETGKEGSLRLIDSVLKELENLDPARELIISSFSSLLLAHFHEEAPELAIGMLWETKAMYYDWLSVLEMVGASYIHAEDADLSPARMDAFTGAGYGVNVWTVNAPDRVNQLFNWGATGIFTDTADRFV